MLGIMAALICAPDVLAQQLPHITAERFTAISQIVQREIDARHVPGAVIIVGGPGGAIYRRAFGNRMFGPHQAALRADAIFDLASLTKVVATTTAVMQLVERGQISLDDKVTTYWPEFGANGKDAITVKELLTHMSGLRPDIALRPEWSGTRAALARIVEDRPIFQPDKQFSYSDINFIVLAELVRRVSGESFESYSMKRIFGPLGMRDTGFNPSLKKRPQIVPTDSADGTLRWGRVQDPTAYRMGGVAGHAGLFSTADDLARFAEMLLGGGTREGVRILGPTTVTRMTSAIDLPGGIKRGLGWDVASNYDSGMANAFGAGSYGHTGYTGTSLWIDPASKTYLIILTSRLYPDDQGDAKPLRMEIADIVAEAVRPPKILPGIDVLADEHFAPLSGLNVGLLTNQTGRDIQGNRSVDILAHAPEVHLKAIFSPEHGLSGDQDSKVESGRDSTTDLPVYSLYGASQRPTPDMLSGLDAIVVDLQDSGARFYTYATTVAYLMEAAAKRNIKIVILDRPNPIGAAGVKGPVLDSALESFTGYFPGPVEHGMTLGELATMFNAENKIGVDLTIVRMRGYLRNSWYDQTGIPWIDPSPNLRSVDETILYPGVALIEGTNVSVGRGTATPFEIIGAPWIDGSILAHYLTQRAIAGVQFEPVQFTPNSDRYAARLCGGIRIELTNRDAIDAPRLGIELAAAIHRLYPSQWLFAPMLSMVGSHATLAALESGQDPRVIAAHWTMEIRAFETLRAKYLLY